MIERAGTCDWCGEDFTYTYMRSHHPPKTCSEPCAMALRLASRGKVSNAPLREAYLRLEAKGEVNAEVMAIRLGWSHSKRKVSIPDGSRVLRSLGLKRHRDGKAREGRIVEHIDYDRACMLVRAMGLDPVDLDL